MLLLVFLACVTAVASKHVAIECSTCVKVDSTCHQITHLFNFDAPFRQTVVIPKMEVHRYRNTLYYAFEPNITDPEYYKVGYVNLDTPETHGILEGRKPVTNFRTFAIDQDKNKIYLGGGDAIYVLDDNNKGVFYSSPGETILSMFFKKNLFFVKYGDNLNIIENEDDLFKPLKQYRNVKDFVIDKNNVVVYMNTTGLYANKLNTNNTVYLSKNNFFRGLSVDLDGVVYAWWIDGIYRVTIETDIEDSRIERVAKIDMIGALTFDNDNNFLFSSSRGLFRLIETNATVC